VSVGILLVVTHSMWRCCSASGVAARCAKARMRYTFATPGEAVEARRTGEWDRTSGGAGACVAAAELENAVIPERGAAAAAQCTASCSASPTAQKRRILLRRFSIRGKI